MKSYLKKITVIFLVINILISNMNIGIFKLFAAENDEGISAIFSTLDIDFIDDSQKQIDKINVGETARMQITLGIASNIATDTTSIRIDLDNNNFYFKDFSPTGDTDGATYPVENLEAVLHINADGTRYITIDNLAQGQTYHLNLDGYFKDTTAPNEKLTVSVDGVDQASISAQNISNKISIENDKTVSTEKISYHEGNMQELAESFPINYKISANVNIPDNWKDTEKLTSLKLEDTLTFPSTMYIENTGSVNLSDFIALGTNSVLNITDFSPIIDGNKIIGIKLNKEIVDPDINTYLKSGEEISLKYNEKLVIEGDGNISNTITTSYTSTNFEGKAEPVTKTTIIDETTGASFENTTKQISPGGIDSITGAQSWNDWFDGYVVEGDKITYVISTTNTGDEKGNVKLTDIIPDGTTLVEAKSDYTANIEENATVEQNGVQKDAVIWNFEDVPAGQTVTATITIQVSEDNDFSIINSVYKNEDYTTPEATRPEIEVKTKSPNLEINKTAASTGGDYSNPGDKITYTITVQNSGTADTTTSIVDQYPDSLEIIEYDNGDIDENNRTITWNDVTIKAGTTVTYTITAKVKEGVTGDIVNKAIVDDKESSVTTSVFDISTAVKNTSITKSVDKSIARKDDTITYTIQLRNEGRQYNIEDIEGKKIITTDVIPEGIEYLGDAYYVLPNNENIKYTEGILYDEESKTIAWELKSEIYNTFAAGAEVKLYIPCKVTQTSSPEQDNIIKNKAISTTIDKESNEAIVTIPRDTGITIEKYVDKVYNDVDKEKLLYENQTGTNKDPVNVDFREGYIACYKVKISNTSDLDITASWSNSIKFKDVMDQLEPVNGDNVTVTIYNSNDENVGTTSFSKWNTDIYLPNDFTIPANDYIILSYELKGASTGVDKATNKISIEESGIESSAQDLTSKKYSSKSYTLIDKNLDWIRDNNNIYNSLQNFEYSDNKKVAVNLVENKYLLYKVTTEIGGNIGDYYTITDTISDGLKFVTGIDTIYGNGPVIAITRQDKYEWGGQYDFAITNVALDSNINGQTLTAKIFVENNNAKNVTLNFYYLVEVDSEILQDMLNDINNGIDINPMELINTANIRSTKVDEDGNPIINNTEDSKVTLIDGLLYPSMEKEFLGSFASGETKKDENGNVLLSNGSANAGANLVWQINVSNEDKEAAKTMKNYSVKELLPEIYYFDTNYLDETYPGAKYYPSIVIYNSDGTVKKSFEGSNFILPEGYEDNNELNWNFEGEDYYLAPGEKLVIKFSTKVKKTGQYGSFLNTARLTTSADFEKENIGEGVQVEDKTIEDTAFANIYAHMTSSYKEIEYNPDLYDADYEQPKFDTGISKKDENGILDNYVQGHQEELVKYTLNMTNESKVNVKDITIIDRLPFIGDIGVIAKYARDSAFDVKWDSFIKAEIYGPDGNLSRTIDSNKVNITFSNERSAVFEQDSRDWLGENDVANWTNEADENTVNVRFVIGYNKDDNQTFLQPGETIKITFYGRVPEYVEKTGESNIAWNNFAYGYKAYNADNDAELSKLSIAEPAKVGVWVKEEEIDNPGSIKVNKKYNAESGDTTVYFVLYKYNKDIQEYEKYSSVISIDVNANSTESYIFENLPNGEKYKVYETDKEGNILDADNNDWYSIEGQGTSVIVAGGDIQEINITNTALEEFKGSITINKIVLKNSGGSVTDGTYSFVLKDELGNYIYEENGQIVKNEEFTSDALIYINAGQSKTIHNLDIGEYKVYEVNEEGINVDNIEDIGYEVSFTPSSTINITRADGDKELTATNTLDKEIEKTVVSGTKTWNDYNNAENTRPDSIVINLLKNGENIDSKTITAEDNWEYTFENLPKYDSEDNLIKYEVVEDMVDGYTTEIDGYNITNTYTTTTSVEGIKIWNDYDNADNTRPDSVTINLLKNGTKIKSKIIKATDDWKYSFTGLDKYDENNELINYTITEDEVPEYTTKVDGYNVINTYTAITSVEGTKTWNDYNNRDNQRPESITVNLLKNGTKVESKTVSETDEWKYSFTNLEKYDENNELIRYKITEDAVEGYISEINGYDITNTYTATTSIQGSKTWIDYGNIDNTRPESITVRLLKDDKEVDSKIVTADDNWEFIFEGLEKYDENNELIKYAITEDKVDGYTTEIDGYNIINKYTATTSVEGTKIWNDYNNADNTRPESITVNLLKDGVKIESKIITENDGWKYSFTGLEKYDDENNEIIYTVEEENVENYESKVEKYNITNTYKATTSIKVTKTWVDRNNKDNTRPKAIIVNLLKDGVIIESKEISEKDNWIGTFENLEKYDEDNQLINYTIEEDPIDGYSTEINGFNIINTVEKVTTSISGKKIWNDYNNKDNTRPNSIIVSVLKDGKVIESKKVTADDDWEYVFTDLDKYDENDNEIEYTITEDEVNGYKAEIKGYNIINTYIAKTSIKGAKMWIDEENANNTRPESITINLLKDGVKIKSKIVTEDDDWKYAFTDLLKYNEDGTEISYTITEDKVNGYTSRVEGTNIINTYIPEEKEEDNSDEKEDVDNPKDKEQINEDHDIIVDEESTMKHYGVKTGDNIIISFMTLIVAILIEYLIRKFKKSK